LSVSAPRLSGAQCGAPTFATPRFIVRSENENVRPANWPRYSRPGLRTDVRPVLVRKGFRHIGVYWKTSHSPTKVGKDQPPVRHSMGLRWKFNKRLRNLQIQPKTLIRRGRGQPLCQENPWWTWTSKAPVALRRGMVRPSHWPSPANPGQPIPEFACPC